MQHQPCGCQACGQTRPGPPPGSSPCRPPQSDCQVPRPPKPPRPPRSCPGQSVLLNKIICSERKCFPNLCAELTLADIPCCAKAPFTLCMVQQSGAAPWWTPLENDGPRGRLCFRVCIPVCCQIKDACGRFFSAGSVVEVDTCFSPSCSLSDCWRHSLVIVPCVRLCAPPVCSQDCVFNARLEVSLEMYLTRPEPCLMRSPEPSCPDLPLYPQPCRPDPPCWPQCPEVQDRCGWPRQG